MTEATWEKPGPGTWEVDLSHAGPAPGPIQRNLYETCLPGGTGDGFDNFGAPLKMMDMHWVNGKFYRRLVPLVGGSRDMRQPPKPVLWLAARLHPAFRAAEKRAAESFAVKRWREEIDRWEREWKPSITARNLALSDIDVDAIDDAALATHVHELHEHLLDTTRLHFRLHMSDMGPLGILMVALEDWGLHRDDTFRALIDASPATREPAAQLRAVASALRDAGVDPASISSIDEVHAVPAASALLDDYLRLHAWRLTTGYDLEDRCLAELPDVLLASIRGVTASEGDGADRSSAAIAELRAQVAAEHRAELDDLIDDARLSYGLRDENGPITYEWPAGLLRRALLVAGRRLHAAGALTSDDAVFELEAEEVAGLLRGATAPTLDEIHRRSEERKWWATLDPPARLGPEEPPPPVSVMPTNLGRLTRVVLTVVGALETESTTSLSGMGIGTKTYVGIARVVHDAVEALATMEPGDVVVAPYTAPTYNAVLSMAGAIVTEEGGLLCHAAVIARELGLPAVIGAVDAMSLIPDGSTVEVNPTSGTVRVLVQ